MPHRVHHRCPGSVAFEAGIAGDDGGRLHRLERGLRFAGALIALRRLPGKTALNGGPQAGRNGRAEWCGNLAQNRCGDLECGVAAEGQATGCRFVEHDAERPQIAAIIGRLAAKNFRSKISQRAADAAALWRARVGERWLIGTANLHLLREAEVEHLDQAFRGDHDVGRFEIAMRDAAVVRARQGGGDLNAVAQHDLWRQSDAAAHLAQALAFDQFHNDVEVALRLANFVDGADVGMSERRGGACFVEKRVAGGQLG